MRQEILQGQPFHRIVDLIYNIPVSPIPLALWLHTFLLKYSVLYRNCTRNEGQVIAGDESDVVGSNSYVVN